MEQFHEITFSSQSEIFGTSLECSAHFACLSGCTAPSSTCTSGLLRCPAECPPSLRIHMATCFPGLSLNGAQQRRYLGPQRRELAVCCSLRRLDFLYRAAQTSSGWAQVIHGSPPSSNGDGVLEERAQTRSDLTFFGRLEFWVGMDFPRDLGRHCAKLGALPRSYGARRSCLRRLAAAPAGLGARKGRAGDRADGPDGNGRHVREVPGKGRRRRRRAARTGRANAGLSLRPGPPRAFLGHSV